MRIRLLPLVIFTAVLMLGVRVGGVFQALTSGGALEAIPSSLAQTAPSLFSPSLFGRAAAVVPVQVAANDPAAPATPAAPTPDAQEGGTRTSSTAPLGSSPPAATPEVFGTVQAEMVQRLQERRQELDKRALELDQREALLKAAEQRIDQKVGELNQLRAKIEGLVHAANQKEEDQLQSLVKIYETMKPQEAARIFQVLEMPVLLDVVERMKEVKTAAILASMDPMKAREITDNLAKRRDIPPIAGTGLAAGGTDPAPPVAPTAAGAALAIPAAAPAAIPPAAPVPAPPKPAK